VTRPRTLRITLEVRLDRDALDSVLDRVRKDDVNELNTEALLALATKSPERKLEWL
jgi:hypothetical protein